MRAVSGRRPIQVSLAVGALVLLIAIVAVLGTWQVLAARSSQQRQIEVGELTAAHLASSALHSAIDSRLQLVENLASQPQLAVVFTARHAREQAKLAAALHVLYPGFASFDIVGATGRLDARWPADAALIGKSLPSQRFVTAVVRTGRPYVSAALQQHAPPRELVVALAAPVRDHGGHVVGILLGTLSAPTIGSMIGGTSLGGGGGLVIVDQAGHVLSGPATGAQRSYRSSPAVTHALAGRDGTETAAVPGYRGARLVGYAPVRSIGWAVIAEDPSSLLDAPIAALTGRLLAIGIAVLLLAIGTAVLVAMLLRRLSREHDQAGALLASVGEGVATLTPTGEPLLVNPALARLVGREAADIAGKPWPETISLYDQRGHRIPWEDSLACQAIDERRVIASRGYDLHLGRADGRRIPVSVTASPLVAGKERLGAVVVFRDVSREREVDQLKTSLVSTVSHELRTPLTMIQGFSELLLDREDLGEARSREALEQVHASSRRLARLIDDLLSVSRIDSGKLTAELVPLQLETVIDEVVNVFDSEHPGRIVAEAEAELRPVMADHDKMVQVVTNLVSNALKYSPADSTVHVVARSSGNHAELSVVDHGIGMTEAETDQIFEKFVRVDRAEVRRTGGSGLGLYITKSLVELQHGQLWVASRYGEGSTFSLSLPFAEAGGDSNGGGARRRPVAEALDR